MEQQKQDLDQLFSLTYEELRRLAYTVRRRDPSITLNPTALIHEVWLKMTVSPPSDACSLIHFKRIAARSMRQLLVEAARRRHSAKRGGPGLDRAGELDLDNLMDPSATCDERLLALHAALEDLEFVSPQQAQIIERRYFGGASVSEIAAADGVSETSIHRELRAARAWLSHKLRSTG